MINISSSFAMCSLFYIILLSLAYFSKKRVNNVENKIYAFLIISNLIGIILDNISAIIVGNNINSIGYMVLTKIILLYFLTWLFLFVIYTLEISFKEYWRERGRYKFAILIYIILAILQILLPLTYIIGIGYIYPTGASIIFLYGVSILLIFIMLISIIINFKTIQRKKFFPLFTFFLLGFVIIILQKNNPSLILLTSSETFVTFLMYFTIENPDVQMIQELQTARDQADKANRAKTDFLSSMSHEIRTPLNAIVGFSDCIMEAETLEEAKENAQDIVNASSTLLEIVNGILDISKIEAGKIEIVNSPYNGPETFLELAKLISPKMKEKGLDFSYTIATDLPKTLYGDHANLKKVVTNLLSNACKYTDRGYVHYEVNCVNTRGVSKLIISVEDSGRGIKKENIDKMFTKFQRLDEDRNTTIEGTGLGLAITKQLVELMGGRIIVHTVYGEGSKFTVVVNQRIEKIDIQKTKKVKTTLDLNNVRILLVDDTKLNLKVAVKLLEKFNANHIITCESGFECLERIQRGEVYDLILLDDMMPKMSGVQTLKKLKEIPGFHIPTIALTANAITGMREKYLADGFNDYLAKPIERQQLIQVVNDALGRNITEELDIPEDIEEFSEENEAVRDEVVAVDDSDSLQNERNNIIPVEDDIEELLAKQLDLSKVTEDNFQPTPLKIDHIEDVETLDDTYLEEPATDIIPVVDIYSMKDSSNEEVFDRTYLEKSGVDVNHALELLGDMEMYNMTIHDFMAEVENKWMRIVEYKDSKDMDSYAIEVHSLKSDCKYLGFMTLADISYSHELKSKENDATYVSEHFNELEEEYKKVFAIAKTYVEHNPIIE